MVCESPVSYEYGDYPKEDNNNLIVSNEKGQLLNGLYLSDDTYYHFTNGRLDDYDNTAAIQSITAQSAPTAYDAMMSMLSFGAFLAINLAVMNLLPIPALDGGRVVCLLLTTAVEAVTHKKINPKYEGYLHAVGMVLLLALMGFVMFKDIFVLIFKR